MVSKNRIRYMALLLFIFMLLVVLTAGCNGKTELPSTPAPTDSKTAEEKAWKPEGTMTIICPYSSGASNDTLSRLAAKYLSEEFGISVVVENVTGSGSLMGIQTALRAKNDGLTFLNVSTPGMELNTFQQGEIDMSKDFSMLAGMQSDPVTWLVSPKSKYETFEQFINAAKAEPGEITVGQTGPWSASYLHLMTLQKELGFKMTFVPFDGGSEALAAVLGGHIDAQIATVGRNYPQHEEGTIRMLAQASKGRHESAPTIPTIEEETGAANYDCIVRGFAIRSDVPENIKQVLIDALEKISTNENYIKEFQTAMGKTNLFIPGNEFDKMVSQNLVNINEFFGELVKK